MDDRRLLESTPLPIACAWRRCRNASDVRDRHDAAYYLFEILLKYLASIAIARYLAGQERDHRVNAVLKGLARPSLGEWLRFLRECIGVLKANAGAESLVQALAEAWEGKELRAPELLRLFNALRAFRTGGESAKEQVSLESLFDEVVAYRNRVLGHGALLETEHYQRFADLFARAFPEAVDRAQLLTVLKLVVFHTISVEAGSRVECGLLEFMGQHPIRGEKPQVFAYGQPAPVKGSLYLLGDQQGGTGRLLLLDPLLVAEKEDVYFLNEADGAIDYLSYATGARHRSSDAERAQADLFERIFGYRPDSSRLSRIGDEIAAAESVATAPEKEGRERIGDYKIVREIGRGAMGVVFEVVQVSLGRRVALKVLPGSFTLDARRVERFRREARATARIHHRSIVPVYEVGEAGGTHYYAMEFIEGRALDDLLAETRTKRPAQQKRGHSSSDAAWIARVVEGFADLAEGLEEAHKLGLVHRDVKPSNILVDGDGRHVLVDFGLVREEEAGPLTRSGEMVGTLGYMSPEQVSRGPVDARADVYSLGATLYEALTLKPPHERETEHELQRAILFEDPLPARKLNPRLHRDLETILGKALEKNPQRRYVSAGDLAKDLRRFLRYEPIHARPQSALTRLSRRVAKHRGKLAVAGAIALLAALSLVLALSSYRDAQRRVIAEYEPRVLRAAMKIQSGRLSERVGTLGVQNVDSKGLFVRSTIQLVAPELRLDPMQDAIAELALAARAVPQRPDAHYFRARALRLKGRDDEALESIERALDSNAEFVPAIVLRASIRSSRGEADAAKKDLERATSIAGGGWARGWLSASDSVARRDWKGAAAAFTEVLQLQGAKDPYLGFSVEAKLGRGSALLETGDFVGAIADFSSAAGEWRDAMEPSLLLGKAHHLSGAKDRARETFVSLWSRADRRDDAALAVAALYQGLSDLDEGLAWAAKIEAPGLRERTRAGFLYLKRDFDAALEALDRALAADSSDALALSLRGWALIEARGDLPGALSAFERAGTVDPKLLGARLGKCAVLERQGKREDARHLYEQAVALDPQNPWPLYHWGWFLLQGDGHDGVQRAEAAELAFRKAIPLDPRNAELHRSLGVALSSQLKVDEAIASYQAALDGDPKSPWAYSNLGFLLFRTVDWKRSEEVTKTAFQLDPSFPHPCRILCELYFNMGDFDEAMRWFNESVARDPTHSPAWGITAGALSGQGKFVDAAAAYRRLIELQDFQEFLGWIHDRFFDLFYLDAKPTGLAQEFDRIADGLNTPPRRTLDQPVYLAVQALVSLHAPMHLDPKKALESATLAVERAGRVAPAGFSAPGRHPSYLGILAEAHARNGQFPEAVRLLEEAIGLPAARPILAKRLDRYRQSALPDLPTLDSVDAALGTTDPSQRRELLASFRATAAASPDCLAYLEGRIAQAEGKLDEAALKFEGLVSSPTRQALFIRRRAECLRSGGKIIEAQRVLQEALDRLQWGDDALRTLWAKISVEQLGETNLPTRLMAIGDGRTGPYFDGVRWLVEQLRAGDSIRINCGGEDYRAKDGRLWSHDRFFLGGATNDSASTTWFIVRAIDGTEDDRLYQTDRWFTPGQPSGYRIPVPSGRYRVSLHFAEVLDFVELASAQIGARVFDVVIEGKRVLEAYDPRRAAGLLAAKVEVVEDIPVTDGILDIDFVPRVDNPKICAIEIERLKG